MQQSTEVAAIVLPELVLVSVIILLFTNGDY